jgi:hypothetical protein
VLVGQSNLKAALERVWGEPTARERMLRVVLEEVARWKSWSEQQRLAPQAPPLQGMMGTLSQLVAQDTEPDLTGESGGRHITKWVTTPPTKVRRLRPDEARTLVGGFLHNA